MINMPIDFLLIFRAISGSNLYGTNTLNSDIDERGVFIPSEKYFLGFENRIEQFTDNKDDTTYFEIRKFLSLSLDSNPNIIELLFIPKDKWLQHTDYWEEIIKKRELFLSKKAKYTFSGYAHSQFHRIKSHKKWLLNPPKNKPQRKDYGLSEFKSDIATNQIGAFNKLLALKLKNIVEFHPLKYQLEKMEETRNFTDLCQQFRKLDIEAVKEIIPISDEFIDIINKENSYSEAERHYNQYEKWKRERNPIRADLEEKFGYDTKHAMHCFRLISEGKELLENGFITFPRPDAKFLLEIKNGLYKYEELENELNNIDETFNKLYEKSSLPNSPNRVKVDRLCQKITRRFLFEG